MSEWKGSLGTLNWHVSIAVDEFEDDDQRRVSIWIAEEVVEGDLMMPSEAMAILTAKEARILAAGINRLADICDERNPNSEEESKDD